MESNLAALLREFGCWGFSALLVVAVRYLYKENQGLHKTNLEMAERILPIIARLEGWLSVPQRKS